MLTSNMLDPEVGLWARAALSNASSLIQPHSFHDLFVVSEITQFAISLVTFEEERERDMCVYIYIYTHTHIYTYTQQSLR